MTSDTSGLLWEEICQSSPDFCKLSSVISKDVNLVYKFMAKANSPIYYKDSRITGVQNALVRIGFLNKLRIPPHVSDALLGKSRLSYKSAAFYTFLCIRQMEAGILIFNSSGAGAKLVVQQ